MKANINISKRQKRILSVRFQRGVLEHTALPTSRVSLLHRGIVCVMERLSTSCSCFEKKRKLEILARGSQRRRSELASPKRPWEAHFENHGIKWQSREGWYRRSSINVIFFPPSHPTTQHNHTTRRKGLDLCILRDDRIRGLCGTEEPWKQDPLPL